MKFKGYFRIPKENFTAHYGELTISKNNKIELTLFSNYSPQNIEKEISKNLSTLYGESSNGTLITLSSPYSTRGRGSSVYKRRIKYNYCLIGENRQINQELFKNYRVEYSNLLGLFAMETLHLNNRGSQRQINKVLTVNGDTTINLIAGISTSSSSSNSKIPTSKFSCLEFERNSGLRLFKVIQEAKYLQYLLSIITQNPVYISKLLIPKLEQRFEQIVDRSILYFYDSLYSSRKKLHEIKTIKQSHSIHQNFQEIISIWTEKNDSWNSIIELLLNGMYNSRSNETSNFLNLITALESWNRVHSDKYDNESLKMYEQLKSILPKGDLKTWFSNKKKNVALRSLPSRLKECLESDILDLTQDQDLFIKKCVTQRNYIAHNLLEHEEPATYLELYSMNLILKLLLEQIIMIELKIDINDIKRILKNGETYKRLLNVRRINNELRI